MTGSWAAEAHLWLIRHGQTDWNLEGRYQGQADPPLNATGRAQARGLLETLSGGPFAAVYSSDLRRARDTAEVVARHVGLLVRVDPRLREVGLGRWEGMLFSDIKVEYAEAWQARQSDPLGARPPGGEALVEVAARAWAAADDMVAAHPGAEVIVVAHGLTLAAIRVRALGLPLGQAYEQIPENGRPERVAWRLERHSFE
jgi:broad specificity phosphatase PhoE